MAQDLDHLGFTANYSSTLLEYSPTGEPPEYYFGDTPGLGAWDHIVVTATSGHSWIGAFQHGDLGVFGVFATPSPAHILVVRHGRAYFVPIRNPTHWHAPPFWHVMGVQRVHNEPLLLLWDNSSVVAYGPDGLLWRHWQLACDDLCITSATSQAILATGWCSDSASFQLNPLTGALLPSSTHHWGHLLTGRDAVDRGGDHDSRFAFGWRSYAA